MKQKARRYKLRQWDQLKFQPKMMKLFVDMSIFLSLDGFSVNFEIYYGNEFMANGHIDTYTTWLF